MGKDLTLIGTILLCSTAMSFAGATYLLNYRFLYAVFLMGLYFLGGVFLPPGDAGTKVRALWIGISICFFGSVLFFLPSSFPV